MDILSIKITNFLAIGDAPEIQLKDKGLVLIQGNNEDDTSATSNGVGKSSIADALCWALYGSTARDESGDAVVNKVAKKNCSVRVRLNDGASKYRITRYRKHSSFKNSTVVEIETEEGNWFDLSKGTEKETQGLINSIMGCSLDVFMGAIYAGQEVAPDLPKMTDKQLKLLIEEAAGVERLESAYEIARGRMNAVEREADAITNAVANADANIESIEKMLAKVQLESELFDKGRTERERVLKLNAEAHKTTLVGLLTKMKEIDAEGLNKRAGELASALAGHSKLLREHSELINAENDAKVAVATAKGKATTALEGVQKLKLMYDNAETELTKPCPSCGRPGEAHSLEDYRAHLKKKIQDQAIIAKDAKTYVEACLVSLLERQKEAEAFAKTIPDTSEISAEQTTIMAALREYGELKVQAQREKSEMERQLGLAEDALTEANPHLSSIKMIEGKLAAEKKKRAEMADKRTAALGRLETLKSVVKVFSPAGVRAHILDTVTPFLNDRTGDYLSALSDGNISAVWTTLATTAKGDLKEKFCIEVTNDKGAESFKGLSGGEKRKVRLATMLALQDLVASRASKPVNIWLGDEIDDALDSAGLERLMTILERKARERGTVLVISHNELRDWCDNVATVTKRGGVSTIEGALVS